MGLTRQDFVDELRLLAEAGRNVINNRETSRLTEMISKLTFAVDSAEAQLAEWDEDEADEGADPDDPDDAYDENGNLRAGDN